MGYTVYLKNEKGHIARLPFAAPEGGTYSPGSKHAEFAITYNYSQKITAVLKGGLSNFDGMLARDTIKQMEAALDEIGPQPPCEDYWADTWYNVRQCLEGLLRMAYALPDCRWEITS